MEAIIKLFTIVIDWDGTCTIDTGRYGVDIQIYTTPLWPLVVWLSKEVRPRVRLILVTGNPEINEKYHNIFDEVIVRPFPHEPRETYYARYFQWKVDTIREIQPDLAIDDDMQVCRILNQDGINALWTPAFAFNGIKVGEAGECDLRPNSMLPADSE